MRLDLPSDQGERLARSAYRHDFAFRTQASGISWKLERRQHFEEIDDKSRDALRRADWDAALQLLEDSRQSLREAVEESIARGSILHRVRVVEEPLTPYVQWELHALRPRAQYGQSIRVVQTSQVNALEIISPLPELVILNSSVLYEVIYTDAGVPDGAVRHTDPGLISAWENRVHELYERGEDLLEYFDRVVAPLPPPFS